MNTQTDQPNVPRHLGIILDGNRRWAKAQGLSLADGYRQTYLNLKVITEAALSRGVPYLSAFVLSTENWNRPPEEIKVYMELLSWVLGHEVEHWHRQNVRVRTLGARDRLSSRILKAIDAAEAKTAGNTGGTLALCLNYGGQQEIADAAAKIVADGVEAAEVTPEKFAQYLYAPDVPPLDLLIRTSGEKRLSGFMLWRAAYAELLFIDKKFPEFTEADLDAALAEYASRQRRFGK